MGFLLQREFIFSLQLLSGIVMMVLIIMQPQGAGLSSAFGGDGSFYRSRRGVEKIVFNLTIVMSGVFLLMSFLSFYAK